MGGCLYEEIEGIGVFVSYFNVVMKRPTLDSTKYSVMKRFF